MDWTPLIGRRYPVEPAALRLATLVHQLGTPRSQGPVVSVIEGEGRLLALDHLLLHPTTLAYLLIDEFRRGPDSGDRRSSTARQVRRLVTSEERLHRPTGRRGGWTGGSGGGAGHRVFEPPTWRRLDDVLAYLGNRDLLRTTANPGTLAYGVTRRGAEVLEQRYYPSGRLASLHLQLCAVLAEAPFLAQHRDLEARLRDVAVALGAFRSDEQVPPEADLLPSLFYDTFQEQL